MDGRATHRPPAADEGSADPALAAATAAASADPARLPEVLAALHVARVLAPVVAVAAESAQGQFGLRVDTRADIALPVLEAPDGHRALLVFTDLAAMARWDPAARPVPVPGPRAAAVALVEGAESMVLDLAGPNRVTLELPEVRALAEGRGRIPAYDDDQLARLVAHALADEPRVRAAWLAPGPGVDARLTTAVDLQDTSAEGAAELGRRLAAALRPLVSQGVRGLDIAVQPVTATGPLGRQVYARGSPD